MCSSKRDSVNEVNFDSWLLLIFLLFLYADDTVIVAEFAEYLQNALTAYCMLHIVKPGNY